LITMHHRHRHLFALLTLALSALLWGQAPAAARPSDGPLADPGAATHRYIVVLADPPLASYAGGIPGLAATSPQAVRQQDHLRHITMH
jgi:hypothetical protein